MRFSRARFGLVSELSFHFGERFALTVRGRVTSLLSMTGDADFQRNRKSSLSGSRVVSPSLSYKQYKLLRIVRSFPPRGGRTALGTDGNFPANRFVQARASIVHESKTLRGHAQPAIASRTSHRIEIHAGCERRLKV